VKLFLQDTKLVYVAGDYTLHLIGKQLAVAYMTFIK